MDVARPRGLLPSLSFFCSFPLFPGHFACSRVPWIARLLGLLHSFRPEVAFNYGCVCDLITSLCLRHRVFVNKESILYLSS